jgi:hypothetical protein
MQVGAGARDMTPARQTAPGSAPALAPISLLPAREAVALAQEVVRARARQGGHTISRATLVACALSLPFCILTGLFIQPGLGLALGVLVLLIGAYEAAILLLFRRGTYRPWLDWVSATLEVSVVTTVGGPAGGQARHHRHVHGHPRLHPLLQRQGPQRGAPVPQPVLRAGEHHRAPTRRRGEQVHLELLPADAGEAARPLHRDRVALSRMTGLQVARLEGAEGGWLAWRRHLLLDAGGNFQPLLGLLPASGSKVIDISDEEPAGAVLRDVGWQEYVCQEEWVSG